MRRHGDGRAGGAVSAPPRPHRGDSQSRSDLTRFARGWTLTLGGSVLSSVLTFVGTVLITRGLQAEGAGLVLESMGLFIILSALATFGADTGLVRMSSRLLALERSPELRPTVAVALGPSLLASLVLAVLTFGFAPALADLFFRGDHGDQAVSLIRLMAAFVPLAAATRVLTAGTRGLGSMVPYVLIQNVTLPGLRPILMLGVLVAGAGVMGVALAWTLPVLIGCAMAAVAFLALLARAERGGRADTEPPRPLREIASEFWRFSIPRGFSSFFQLGVIYMDVLLVGGLRSPAEAGIYAAAARLVAVGTLAMEALGYAIAPQISGLLSRDERGRAQVLFQTATWWLVAMTWPVFMALAVYAPLLLRIFGDEFVAGQHALLILSLGILAQVGTGNNKVALIMAGRSGWNLAVYILSFTVNISLNLLLIPRYGIVGAALAWTASFFVDNGVTAVILATRIRLHPFGPGWTVTAVGAVVCFGVVGLLFRFGLGLTIPSFVAYGIVSTLLYGALLWRFRRLLRLPMLIQALRSRRAQADPGVLQPT